MDTRPVVSRFAPSPTGYLHVGGARTALFAWLLARHYGGKFYLRIEDTDLARSNEESCRRILEDLTWLGLRWDNDPVMHQSQRLDVYNPIIDGLLSRGLAYKAYETSEELEALRRAAERNKHAFIYHRPKLTEAQIRQFESEGRPHVVRLAMPVREHRFRDVVLDKDVTLPPSQVQDFIIRKADGMPTYHFAVVVDDQEMGVTHVLRGQEHLLNTINHIALQEALGYPRPIYGHLPVILNAQDGSKMGKRDRDKKIRHHANLWLKAHHTTPVDLAGAAALAADRVTEWLADDGQQLDGDSQRAVMRVVGLRESDLPEIMVHDFRANGYLPEVLLNFLALLGWSPGGDRERMTRQEMIDFFSLEGVGKSNSRFDRGKLLAFNTEACAGADGQRLLPAFRDFLSVNPDSPLNSADDAALSRVLAIKPGFRTLREVEEQSRFFFVPDERIEHAPDAIDKVLRKHEGQGLSSLREVRAVLATAASWTAAVLESAVNGYCQQHQLALGKVAQPIRLAIAGSTISPPIFQSLEFLGRQRTLARIDRCLSSVQP
jgi:glutamyl-tRNA synthetase